MIKTIKKLAITTLLCASGVVVAAEEDVAALQNMVAEKAAQIEANGILPTYLELELITGDIVDEQVRSGELSIEAAVEKYQLTPAIERYIRIKQAARAQQSENKSGDGAGLEPPKP